MVIWLVLIVLGSIVAVAACIAADWADEHE